MSNLLRELKEMADEYLVTHQWDERDAETCGRAANEIESLRAENETLKQQVSRYARGMKENLKELLILKQQTEQGKRDAVPEGYTLVPTEILDRFPEINPSNYDHDDACALNAWGVELVLATAPKQEK